MEQLAGNNRNILFLGFRNDAEKIVNIFDCFVMSSVKEGFPYAILEAIKSKVPVIATNVGAIPEILEHGKLGLICDSKDVAGLTKNMIYAIENKEEIDKISEKAYESSKNKYSLENMIELTKAAYESNS
jgi:glycosyltransferase involved in cell wall biosynthesis